MSGDDWAVGDLALCVAAGRTLVEGRIYTVEGICAGARSHFRDGGLAPCGLWLLEQRSIGTSGSYDPARFRKIKPDHIEACEEEFTALLKRSRRPVTA